MNEKIIIIGDKISDLKRKIEQFEVTIGTMVVEDFLFTVKNQETEQDYYDIFYTFIYYIIYIRSYILTINRH